MVVEVEELVVEFEVKELVKLKVEMVELVMEVKGVGWWR